MYNKTLKSSRPHIGIFGRRNVGKSSIINSLSGQDTAIVSNQAGTTTDPVSKTMEIHGFGPVVIIDTAGIDDTGELGMLRINKAFGIIKRIDVAVLVLADNIFGNYEKDLIENFKASSIPFLIIHNKSDITCINTELLQSLKSDYEADVIEFSTIVKKNLDDIINSLHRITPASLFKNPTILGDFVSYGDLVLLVTPVDLEAPEGRIILPQVQTIRDCLDNDCITIILKERELDVYWKKIGIGPKLVVTDSQVFLKVAASTPSNIPMTSFSILFARIRGAFEKYLVGTPHISSLKDGDRVLIMESCSHHVAADDIGRVKIPRWLTQFTGKNLIIEFAAGLDDPVRPITEYSLVIQCGGCMVTKKQIMQRIQPAIDYGIPVTNYGMAIAFCLGIYERAVSIFTKGNASAMDYI